MPRARTGEVVNCIIVVLCGPHFENPMLSAGSTITERLEYLFDNYGWYKEKLLEARNGLKLETLTPEALIENFKQTVTKRSLVQLQ